MEQPSKANPSNEDRYRHHPFAPRRLLHPPYPRAYIRPHPLRGTAIASTNATAPHSHDYLDDYLDNYHDNYHVDSNIAGTNHSARDGRYFISHRNSSAATLSCDWYRSGSPSYHCHDNDYGDLGTHNNLYHIDSPRPSGSPSYHIHDIDDVYDNDELGNLSRTMTTPEPNGTLAIIKRITAITTMLIGSLTLVGLLVSPLFRLHSQAALIESISGDQDSQDTKISENHAILNKLVTIQERQEVLLELLGATLSEFKVDTHRYLEQNERRTEASIQIVRDDLRTHIEEQEAH